MNFFKISGRSVSHGEWGDYGDILQHGMTAHSRRVDGKLALERTGPYIPPITLPGIGDIVLTSEARQLLEASDLSGFSFAPVEKKFNRRTALGDLGSARGGSSRASRIG